MIEVGLRLLRKLDYIIVLKEIATNSFIKVYCETISFMVSLRHMGKNK